jgi:hypothetical protein
MLKDLDAQSGHSRDATPSEVMRGLIIGVLLGMTLWVLAAWVIEAAI